MNRRTALFTYVRLAARRSAGAGAHHSTAMYDTQNPVTVNGTVKKVEWTNPHAFLYLEVKDEKSGKSRPTGKSS